MPKKTKGKEEGFTVWLDNDMQALITKVREKAEKETETTQADEDNFTASVVFPKIPLKYLAQFWEDSYVVQGIVWKITQGALSGFTFTQEEGEANQWEKTEGDKKSLLDALSRSDLDFLCESLITTGNAFMEVIRNKAKDKVLRLEPVLPEFVRVLSKGGAFVQQINGQEVYFNKFTPVDERANEIEVYTNNKKKASSNDILTYNESARSYGYNDTLNEIYHFKASSLRTKYYWTAIFESCIDQILVLLYIDRYYNRYFENGTIKPTILTTEKGEELSETEQERLKTFIQNSTKGFKNAFNVSYLTKHIKKLDLVEDLDPSEFKELRKDLVTAISIATNVPYDLLSPENSNRATAESAIETFNMYAVKPFQRKLLKNLKCIFLDGYSATESLQFKDIDTQNQLEEMKVLTWYVSGGIMEQNEARKIQGLEEKEGGDKLKDINSTSAPKEEGVGDIEKTVYKELEEIDEKINKITKNG